MDVERKGARKRKIIRQSIFGTVALIATLAITWGVSRLKPAAPSVERATVWIDQVKRGPMVRQVRGLGTLVAQNPMQIAAQFDGIVMKRQLPGIQVHPDTILLVLSNPDMELDANKLEWQVKQAEANYEDLKVKMESQKLDQESTVRKTQSDFTQAKLTLDRDRELLRLNLKPDIEVKLSEANTRRCRAALPMKSNGSQSSATQSGRNSKRKKSRSRPFRRSTR